MYFKAEVNNTPKDVKTKYIVARRDDYTSELWYYEGYDDKKQADDVATELDNGIVLEVKE